MVQSLTERLESVKKAFQNFRDLCDEPGIYLYFCKNPRTGSWGTLWTRKEELERKDGLEYRWASYVGKHNRQSIVPEEIAEWLGKLDE